MTLPRVFSGVLSARLIACAGDGDSGPGGPAPTGTAPCHRRDRVRSPRRDPGDPDASCLTLGLRVDFSCLDGTPVACGSPMPLAKYPFAEGDRNDLEPWIRDGAR